MPHRFRTAGFVIAVSLLWGFGCQTANPGPFAGANYQQTTVQPTLKVSKVTVLRMSEDAATQLLSQAGVAVVGKSQFQIDSDDIAGDSLAREARAQGERVGANVVLLFQHNIGQVTKHKTVEKKSDFQRAAEGLPVAIGGSSAKGSGEESCHERSDGSLKCKDRYSEVGVGGAMTLGQITALLPGSVTQEDVSYQADLFEIHAIYARDPDYPGL